MEKDSKAIEHFKSMIKQSEENIRFWRNASKDKDAGEEVYSLAIDNIEMNMRTIDQCTKIIEMLDN